MKERRAASAVNLGDFDPHDAEIEQLLDELVRDFGLLVHLADQRAHLTVGKLVDAVSEQPLVLGQQGEWKRGGSVAEFTPWMLPLIQSPAEAGHYACQRRPDTTPANERRTLRLPATAGTPPVTKAGPCAADRWV